MALSRTWYSRGNIPISDFTTAALVAKSIIWAMKAALKDEITTGTLGAEGAMPSGGKWTCEGSSDSSTAGMDASDRWGATFDATKIVRASGAVAHSWIVLKSPAAIGPYYICLDWNAAADTSLSIYASKSAYTGGSVTAKPTSTKEWTVLNATTFNIGTATSHRFHKAMDADGNFFFSVGQHTSGIFNLTFWGVTLSSTQTGEQSPFFTAFQYTTGTRGAGRVATITVGGRTGDDAATATTTTLGDIQFAASTFGGTIQSNILTGNYDVLPVFVCTNTAGKSGVRGIVPDVHICGVATVGGGEPTSGAQERMLLGDLLVPSSVAPSL